MSKILTAEEFENTYNYLCVEIKNTDNNSEQIFEFANEYANYLHKAKVESSYKELVKDSDLDALRILALKDFKQKLLEQ